MKQSNPMSMVWRCAFAGAAFLLAAQAGAQQWPTRPIHIVVPYPAGGSSDNLARGIGTRMTEEWGQPVVVDNKPGGSGNIAAEFVARAPADGYNILIGGSLLTTNASLSSKLNYDVLKDFTPVVMLSSLPNVLVVHPSLPVQNVAGLIAYAKANPGKLNYSSAGNGTAGHIAGELFASSAGIKLQHIPYKGAPQAVTDLVAGQVQMSFVSAPTAMSFIREGKLRALGVSSAVRHPALPNVPTIIESGVPGFAVEGWNGLMVPAGTPPEIVEKIRATATRAMEDPAMVRLMGEQGARITLSPTTEFAAYMRRELEKSSQVVKSANIRAD